MGSVIRLSEKAHVVCAFSDYFVDEYPCEPSSENLDALINDLDEDLRKLLIWAGIQ